MEAQHITINKNQYREILKSSLFQKTIERYLGKEKYEIVVRQACFFIRLKEEDKQIVKRLILLPPKGYTSDKIELLNPHPEALKARAKVLGKIKPEKKGYSPCIEELTFAYSLSGDAPTQSSSAYATYSDKYCDKQQKSWRQWFYVVKKNRLGEFHNLINDSDEWIVLVLEKWLVDQKPINIKPFLKKLPPKKEVELQSYINKIQKSGDTIFMDKELVENVLKFPPDILIPIFMRMLNCSETGRHECCTFFAFLLKLAKNNNSLLISEVKKTDNQKIAPYYYLADLKKKLHFK